MTRTSRHRPLATRWSPWLGALALGACASAPAPPADVRTPDPVSAVAPPIEAPPDPLADVTLPELPDWTDRYAGSQPGDGRFFIIDALMAREGLTRWQAVELQNHFRDLSRAGAPGGAEARFAEALRRVRAGDYESGYREAVLAAAPAIVVFDLDDTLYDQRVDDPACAQLTVNGADGKERRIALAPGWAEALGRLRDLGVAVALFSANLDEPTHENLAAWTWQGAPLLGNPAIAAVMTNSYLVRQSKHEGAGRENPRRGTPVMEASKDLRLFDESLSRVIIVDDNPGRLFQLGNARALRKFDGDMACAGDGAERKAQARQLTTIIDEIAESLAWSKAHSVPFAVAYRPYSLLGSVATRFLIDGAKLSPNAARAYLRAHPDVVDASF